jgi:glucose/arabinose dehydrogenase
MTLRRAAALRPLALSTLLLAALAAPGSAATLPAGFDETVIGMGLNAPTAMAFSPIGTLVTEQGGNVRLVRGNGTAAMPFASFSVGTGGERGLLGVAVDPDFVNNNFIYVYYTATAPVIHNRVSRITANAQGDMMVPGSEVVLFDLDPLSSATNHNGGHLRFGPDGKLYIAAGENANGGNSQSLNTVLGKILRINSDGTIPNDNPFFGTTTGNNRAIFAWGLRNPYTFTFQRGTGKMYINDVGQSTWEEIDLGGAGSNYGWPTTEGPTNDPSFVSPLFFYGHGNSSTTGCAITGGAFYNPVLPQFPSSFTGSYFFGDFCSGWVRRYDPVANMAFDFASGIGSPVDLEVTDDGSLYYLAYSAGTLTRVRFVGTTTNNPPVPAIANPASQQLYSGGDVVAFSGGASDAEDGTIPPSGLRWQIDFHHNGQVDTVFGPTTGITGGTYTIPTTGDNTTNAFYRFTLRATDSMGAQGTTFHDIVPRLVNLSLATQPAGLSLKLDGVALGTPVTFQSVVGMPRTLAPVTPQTVGGVTYQFQSWTDGGSATRTFLAPAANTTYTATFSGGGGPPPPPPPVPPGVGLAGTYYNNANLTRPIHVRIDPMVDFDFGSAPPVPRVGAETFSVTWTGQVRAKVTGHTTFTTLADDGVRLFVNGVQIIDDWTDHSPAERSGAIDLVAGTFYDVRLEYYENSGSASIRFFWSAPGLAREVVPKANLYPYALLVGGSTTLGAGDAAVRDRLIALGFAPLVKTAGAVGQIDGAGKGLVLISSTADASQVNTKFRAVLAPVLAWESAVFDDLGMTGTGGGDSGATAGQSRLRIVAAGHPLAGGLPAGGAIVTTSSIAAAWGVPNANATVVAKTVAGARKPAIFGYDRGAGMFGLNAPNRRVGFFLDDGAAALLTAQGKALLDAAIRWAAGL